MKEINDPCVLLSVDLARLLINIKRTMKTLSKTIIPVGALALVAIGAGAAAATQVSAASETNERPQLTEEEREERRELHQQMREEIERSVENIDSGVRITLVSDNSDLLDTAEERATERHARHMEREDAPDVTQSITRDGSTLTIELTSDDAGTVERIQDRAEKGPRRHHRVKHRFDGERGERPDANDDRFRAPRRGGDRIE